MIFFLLNHCFTMFWGDWKSWDDVIVFGKSEKFAILLMYFISQCIRTSQMVGFCSIIHKSRWRLSYFIFWSVYIIVMNRQISYVKTQYRNMRNKEDWYEHVYERWKIYMITFKYYSTKQTSKYIKCIGQLFVSNSQKVVKIWAKALHLKKHDGALIT